ncbi:hypothetical protein KDA23_02585, partial [Candidatus Saccharibacteria bacterium]|nr:hypothetical protein [Candidatus Saccharibacteria bacterium]
MYQGNWKCSSCGGAITELPFEPRNDKGLTCRACYVKQKNGGATAPAPEPNFTGSEEPPDVPFDAEVASEPPPPPEFPGATDTPTEKPRF